MKHPYTYLYLFILIGCTILSSCTNDEEKYPSSGGETTVQMTFLNAAHTRALTANDLEGIARGTEEEKKINSLDLLVFKNDAFQYRRHATKYSNDADNVFRATLKIDSELTVYFIANSRDLIETLVSDGYITDGSAISWEAMRVKLIDVAPSRFLTTGEDRSNLPMWGMKSGLSVAEGAISHWTGINLLRSVAGVDIYLDQTVTNFTLVDSYLYFVPDRGCLAPSAANYNGGGDVNPESASGMKTRITLGPVAATDRKVANKFYLYDNDTDESTFVSEGEDIHRYTRVVVGGVYNSQTYYYPIDFLIESSDRSVGYDKITRNTKYLFQITEVSGPGYPTPEVASKEPPVHMTTHVYNWNVVNDKHVGYDGTYYISVDKKAAILSRSENAVDYIAFTTNARPEIVTIDFTTSSNGEQVALDSGLGVKNNRFSVEKVLDDTGAGIAKLKFTALGDYDPVSSQRNNDAVIVRAGNVQFIISITQRDGSSGDWELGGKEDTELVGNN